MEGFGVKIFFNVVVVGFLFQLLEVALARGGGFSVDLIHRDSPHSPFFDPSKTQAERLTDAFRRSVSRVGRFRPTAMTSDGIQSRIVPSAGEYLMNLYIGTPPVPVIAIVDTGSDLTWTQCRPCTHCYKQVVPLFDPKNSSTYRDSSCGTSFCLALGKDRSCSKEKKCTFRYSYADGSFTGGNLASETLTVDSTAGKPVSFPGFAFGCGHSSGGIFDKSSSGIVGLGGGELSLISQLKSTINGLFSYCLLPVSTDSSISSRINFGASGRVSGYGTVSTPLRLPYKGYSKKTEVEEGNIIVDSGTTYTFLPQEFYSKLEKSVANSIKGKRVRDPNGIFSLCYNTTAEINAPIITAHFKDANVELQPLNTFMRMQEDLVCFTVAPTSDIGVLGNLAQVNFLVGFDLRKKRGFSKKAEVEEGNIIVDSGTTYTYLPLEFYVKLEESVAHSIKGKRVRDPNGISSLCYNTTVDQIDAPIITAHFKDANVELQPWNTFLRMQEDLVCFTVLPTSDIGILGNLAQVNFLVGFDLRKKRVSFKAADCTLH
ncbi:unnamed protein product, partial [Vitis vinifera]